MFKTMKALLTIQRDSERVESIAISSYLSLLLRTNEHINEERLVWLPFALPLRIIRSRSKKSKLEISFNPFTSCPFCKTSLFFLIEISYISKNI